MVLITLVGITCVFYLLPTCNAIEIGNGLDLSGAIRWRTELDNKDFSNHNPMIETQNLRTRINLDVTSIDNARIFIQVQDSRDLGYTTAGMNNDTNLGIHQAYLTLTNGMADSLSIQVGRFEASYGRERLIGTVGWSNIGRSFDGVRVSHKKNKNFVDVFWMKMLDRSFYPYYSNKDVHFIGTYVGVLDGRLDGYFLFDWDIDRTHDHYDLARYTTGIYYHGDIDKFTVNFDAAYQGGEQAQYDISASMIAGEITMNLDGALKNIGAGLDFTSGDDNYSDDKIKYFNNLYYTGHKFRGYMDYFTGSVTYGLFDYFLKASAEASSNFTFSADFHIFQTVKEFDYDSKSIGQELDLTGNFAIKKQLSLQSGVSIFWVSDDWVNDADPGTWCYIMLDAGF